MAPAGTKTKFLLVRGLKANADENALAKAMTKFYLEDSEPAAELKPTAAEETKPEPPSKPTSMPLPPNHAPAEPKPVGATPDSLKRVFLIRDRKTNKSMKYGFAEYHSSQDASRALEKHQLLGKTSSTTDTLSLDPVDPGVFAPVLGNVRNQKFLFSHNGAMYQYRDFRYYASAETINTNPPRSTPPPSEAPQAKKKRARNTLGQLDGGTSKKAKTNMGFMNQWQQKQAELRGETGDGNDGEPSRSESFPFRSETNPSAEPDQTSFVSGANQDTDAVITHSQSFIWQRLVDGKMKNSCLLCLTDIPPAVAPEKHVKESQLHAKNLRDDDKYRKGLENLKKRGVDPGATLQVKPDPPSKTQETFIDRAALRREQEAKADGARASKINISLGGGGGQQQKQHVNASAASGASGDEKAAPSYGKGMAMLQKAGWKAGQALGSGEGDGITAPIETSMYAAGVGLGHEGGRIGDAVEEASRSTRGGGQGFVEKTKDVARERFEKMG